MVSLCSKCSVPVKPIVAVDVDGTLSEYHYSLAKHACAYWNVPVPHKWWDGTGNYEDFLGITQAQYREAKLAFRQGGYKRWVPTMAGITSLALRVQRLREAGKLEVWITTTRPWNRLDSVDPDTRFWLDIHFPVYDHILYGDHKYVDLGNQVEKDRVVMVVDDLPEMIEEAAAVFGVEGYMPVMMERFHNEAYRQSRLWQSYMTCRSLADVGEILEARVETWYEERSHG